MKHQITENTIRQFITEVSEQHHAMAGAVIAASAAQAAALGRACMQISLERRGEALDAVDVAGRIQQITNIKNSLADWCDRDATAIAEFVALREAGDELGGQQLLCHAPAEISRLAIEVAENLQDFRSLVSEQVQDDLEMSLRLLTGAAHAALLLLDSNLRLWPDEALLDEFEPVLAELESSIRQLTPVARIRPSRSDSR
jgi:formiminotetrahydrofolate cyclodeaminase